MDWISNEVFITFIDEVGTLPTSQEENIKEVTEGETEHWHKFLLLELSKQQNLLLLLN